MCVFLLNVYIYINIFIHQEAFLRKTEIGISSRRIEDSGESWLFFTRPPDTSSRTPSESSPAPEESTVGVLEAGGNDHGVVGQNI
jgi:hypothetical protein